MFLVDDIENQNAAQVAKEADPTGVRTIGNFTRSGSIVSILIPLNRCLD